jgi:hypothetical protein
MNESYIFNKCATLCGDDMFWKGVFEDLALNKFPYGVFINDSNFSICCNLKEKDFSFSLEHLKDCTSKKCCSEHIENVKNNIHNLFTKRLGIFSIKDKEDNKSKFTSHETNLKNESKIWNNINKNSRNAHYETYVINMKNKYNLTLKQSRYLLALITTLINFKIISNKNIIFEEEEIKEIEGIHFVKKNNGCKIEKDKYVSSCEGLFVSKTINTIKRLDTNWMKYISDKT